jgi:hypothetical protein
MIDLNLARYKTQLKAFNEHLLTVDIPTNLVDGDGIEAISFTPYDIQTLSEDNDVVHFRVQEAPGWLFGIWYNIDLREHHDIGVIVDLHCSFFAQYERLIDKFKPSRSTLCVHEKKYNFRGVHKDFEAGFCEVADMIKFIKENDVIEFQDLMDYAVHNEFDTWFPLLCDNSAFVIGQYIKSQRHRRMSKEE